MLIREVHTVLGSNVISSIAFMEIDGEGAAVNEIETLEYKQ